MARRTKSPARKALPSWLQHQEEQPHDALVEGIVLDLPWIKGGDGKVVARELRGQGPFKGEPEKFAASERAAYYEARKHQPAHEEAYDRVERATKVLGFARQIYADEYNRGKDDESFTRDWLHKQLLAKAAGTEVLAWVKRIHTIEASVDPQAVTLEAIESNIVRCPDASTAAQMVERIESIGRDGDSCGGVIECVVRNPAAGLGMPVFDKLEADLAKAVMSLPATKGFEIGSGFSGTLLKGSEHNDAFVPTDDGRLQTATNNSGGIQGGISNGEPIVIRVAFKPTATIRKEQQTVDSDGKATTLAGKGRHDPCVLPRAVPMVEAMVALVLADHLLRQQGQCSLW